MKTIFFKAFIFTFSILIIGNSKVYSQSDDYKEKITVVGVYIPEISDSRKITLSPDIKDTLNYIPKVDYLVVARPLEVPVELKPITAARMTGESFSKIYENHIRAGLGNYLTPYAEFTHSSIRNKKFRYSLNMKHLSSAGKIKEYAHPGISENLVNLNGSWLTSNYTYSAGTKYTRNALHYYGFQPDSITPDYEKSDIKQVFNLYDFYFEGKSNYSDASKFHHSYKLDYKGLWDKYETAENNLILSGNMKKAFNIANALSDEAFYMDFRSGVYGQNNKLQSITTGLVSLKPYLNVRLKEIELKAGVDVSAQIDSVGVPMAFPFVRMDLRIVPSHLNIFLGYSAGELNKNTFRELSDENPFINTEILPLGYSITKNKLYGGINGGFGGKFNYKLGVEHKMVQNMPLFVNDTTAFMNDTTGIYYGNRFDLIFDTVEVLSFKAEFQVKFNSKFNLIMNGAYNVYSPNNETYAWHMPLYDISLMAEYNIQNKLFARAGIYVFGDRWSLDTKTGLESKLKPIWDFNLGAEYRYNKLMSAFVNVSNFTAQRHYLWNNYPSQRINIMAGVTYTF